MRTATFVRANEFARDVWIAMVSRSRLCSVELYPEVLRWSAPDGEALIYADYDGSTLETMAVLVPKVVHPLGRSGVNWIGRLAGYRLAGDQLVGRSDREACDRFVFALSRYLNASHADCMYFEDIDAGSPLWQSLTASPGSSLVLDYPSADQSHWRIRFPEKAEDYWKSFSAKSRYNMRRQAKRFEHRIERFTECADVATFVADAQYICERSWQGQRIGLRIRNENTTRARLRAMARVGALRSYILYQESKPVAFVYGWQHNGRFQYEEIGYDGEYAKHSPGAVLLYRVLEDLVAERSPELLDFGRGDAEYKRVFGNEELRSGPVLVMPTTLKARVSTGISQARRAVDQGMRELLRKSGLYAHARRLYHSARKEG